MSPVCLIGWSSSYQICCGIDRDSEQLASPDGEKKTHLDPAREQAAWRTAITFHLLRAAGR
jgi:hypothetical protein